MKKIRGDKPIGVIIHIYMERTQNLPVLELNAKNNTC
jgi:hypothetical protein